MIRSSKSSPTYSATELNGPLDGDISLRAIQAAVDKVLAVKRFSNSSRHSEFLRFTVGEALAGRADNLKEYVLGLEVFHRRDSFDPRLSPIVRVGASRVRAKLRAYYENEGANDPVLIEFPTGSYVPIFRRRHLQATFSRSGLPSWMGGKWKLGDVTLLLLSLLFLLSMAAFSNTPFSGGRDRKLTAPSAGPYQWASIAVLPFPRLGSQQAVDYMNTWLTKELEGALMRTESLRVVTGSSTYEFKTVQDLQKLGARLHVDALLQGSAQKIDQRSQINMQLIDVKNGYHLWSETYDCELKDIFIIQYEIARAVTNGLRVRHSLPISKPEPTSLEAYNLYLDGLYQMNHWNSKGLLRAVEYFQKSIALDPQFALAYSRLAAAYIALAKSNLIEIDDGLPKAQRAAETALKIHSNLAEAHAALAAVHSLSWRWSAAKSEYDLAIQRDPDNGELREQYSINYLLPMRRINEALEEAEKAQTLDPVSASVHMTLGRIYYCKRDYEHTIEQCRQTLDSQPAAWAAYFDLGSAFARKKMFTEATAAFQSVEGPRDRAVTVSLLGYVAALSGRLTDGEDVLDRLNEISKQENVSSYYRALIHLALEDENEAIRLLELAYEAHDPSLMYLAVNPEWDSLRSNRKFIVLLEKIGLPSVATVF